MKRHTVLLGYITVALLLACLIAILTIPRFNYGLLVQRQTQLEAEQNLLRKRYESSDKLNAFTDENVTRRSALLESISSLPDVIDRLQKSFSAASEEVESFRFVLGDLQDRVERLEKHLASAVTPEPSDVFALYRQSYTEKLDLSKHLRDKAEFFSAQKTAEWDFEQFLREAIAANCLSYKEGDPIPLSEFEELAKVFSVFQGNMLVLNRKAYMKILELAAQADIGADYLEAPPPPTPESGSPFPPLSEPGILHTKSIAGTGLLRTYYLPYRLYPELKEFEAMRENARDHLVRDIVGIDRSRQRGSSSGSTSGGR